MDERKYLILLKGQNKTKESRFHCQRNGPARLSLPRGESEEDIPGQSLIFPFGGNASQFQAVEWAMNNQLSVIQGPPGTKQAQRDRLKDSIFEKY